MFKIVQFFPEDRNGVDYSLIHPGHFEKTADVNSEIANFVSNLEPEEKKIYILVNALSSGEYFGANRNGDYFPEQSLVDHHPSFVSNGHVYKHHINKDPKKALGKILASAYNNEMKRVELVLELDPSIDDGFIRDIQSGKYPSVSMGTKVPHDECSICGNKAKTLSAYCGHLKREMGNVYPDGRKVYAINETPKFFDISFVRIPADSTAGMMRKVASHEPVATLSAELGEEYLKQAEEVKESEINKQVKGDIEAVSTDPKHLLVDSQPDMPKDLLKKAASKYSLDEIFSTFVGMRMMPKLADFQRVVLYKQGHEKLADALDREGEIIVKIDSNTKPAQLDNVKLANFNDEFASDLTPHIPDYSLTKPLVMSRVLAKYAENADLSVLKQALGSQMEQDGMVPGDPVHLESEPSSVKKFLFGHTEEPLKSTFKNPTLAMAGLGSLYYGLHKVHQALGRGDKIGQMDAFLMRRP